MSWFSGSRTANTPPPPPPAMTNELLQALRAKDVARVEAVLKANPAATWYQKKCCFSVVGEGSDYFQMRLDMARFKACSYKKSAEVGT